MTDTKVAVVAETNRLQANRKVAKEFQIRKKYKAELVVLNARYSFLPPKTSLSSHLNMSLDLDISQSQSRFPHSFILL